MRNKDGDFKPSELIFVDFDQAAYGFRMFDLLYWAANTNQFYSIDEIKNMMQGEYKKTYFLLDFVFKFMSMHKHMMMILLLLL